MKEIVFATGNKGKVFSLVNHFHNHELDIIVTQVPLELMEPQADTVAEIVRMKAKQAYEQLQQPLIVEDSSFHIEALGGFPGPYIKYMVETIGAPGIIDLLHGRENRKAYFMSAIMYIDEKGEFHEFSSLDVRGDILEHIDDADHPEALSDLWKIFVPEGWDKPLSRMNREEHSKRRNEMRKNNTPYEQLVDHLKNKLK